MGTVIAQPNKYSRMAGMLHIKNFGITSILECGCGLGYYAEWIRKEIGITPKSVDISEVAIQKAKNLFPHLDFEHADIVKDLIKNKHYDCIMLSEIIWYILPDLKTIFKILKKEFEGKYLIVNQVFYKRTQKYGTEYFTNLSEFIAYVPLTIIGKCEATIVNDTTIETSTIFKI
jgi:SAM-dependent methyltransferase